LLLSHHDPRGAYPALKGPRQGIDSRWDVQRHVPLTFSSVQTGRLRAPLAPRFTDTEEIHAGHYTPLRPTGSLVRSQQWFEMGYAMEFPLSSGYPGWSRFQQEWHMNSEFTKGLDEIRAIDEKADGLTPPLALLQTLVGGSVRAIFKGHDNRFARASMEAGESIFGSRAEAELTRYAPAAAGELDRLHLRAPLTVFHTADISDFDSDGHGFLWVEADALSMEAYEIDHR
jgi:hypothetical protein